MKKLSKLLALILTIFISNSISFAEDCSNISQKTKEFLMNKLKEHSLIIYKDNNITTFDEHNLEPLLIYLNDNDFGNTCIFDKTVGKAAAMLYVYGDAKCVHANTISKSAIKILKKNNIKYEAKNIVSEIKNKKNTDLCPFEKLIKDVDNPTLAYGLIYKKTYPDTSIVYYTSDITSENLVKLYKLLDKKLPQKVAVKIHSGEPGGNNFLKPKFMKPLVKEVDGTIVECNTAYQGRRYKTEDHLKVMAEHGFTKIAKVDIMDSEGEFSIPVPDGLQIKQNFVGNNLKKYKSMLVLSHFKGHQMGGFGGALKNLSTGVASAHGKAYIHGAGDVNKLWTCEQNKFLEAMADADKSVIDYMNGNLSYINVMNNMSIDCDCNNNPTKPEIKDIGMLASIDPVALDKACLDLVYKSNDKGKQSLIKRIESKNGKHIIDSAEKLKIGTTKYHLIKME